MNEPACKWGTPTGLCGRTETTRPYPCGPRCAEHTPARLAGKPEPGDTEIRPLPFASEDRQQD